MKNVLKRLRLQWERRGLTNDLNLVYRERRNNEMLERQLVRRLDRVNTDLLSLEIGARR